MTLSPPDAAAALCSEPSINTSPPSKPLPPVDVLFVWDFDWTVINCNSDEYVPSKFLGDAETERRLRKLIGTLGPQRWHECVSSLINDCMTEKGCGAKEVREAAAAMPYLAEVRGAIVDIGADSRCGQMIISDGNDDFIGAFLKENDLERCFTHGLETNLASWGDGDDAKSEGQFSVVHQSTKYGGHSCASCPPNLCKSQVLRDILSKMTNRPTIVYVGDGSNDACPALRVLREGDVLLARAGRRLADPNSKTGPQTDGESSAVCSDASNELRGEFPILSVLKKAEAKEGLVPKCRVAPWEKGAQLRSLVCDILGDSTSR